MLQIFHEINIDWLGKRRFFIGISIVLMLAGMGTAFYRHKFHPNGTEAFNLGVDFKGGTVITLRFKQPPPADSLRAEINKAGIKDAVIQSVLNKPGMFLIKVPHQGFEETSTGESQAGVDAARAKIKQSLNTYGAEADPKVKTLEDDPKAAYKIEGTDAVGQVASKQLRNQAIADDCRPRRHAALHCFSIRMDLWRGRGHCCLPHCAGDARTVFHISDRN